MAATTPPAPSGDQPHAAAPESVLAALETDAEGLKAAEAAARLERYGPNRLPEAKGPGPLLRFLRQFHDVLIYVLLAAAALSLALGHALDAAVILAVVVLNAMIGFVQEGKAARAMDAIRGMIDPSAMVQRDGRRQRVPAMEIVPGDIVLLEAGDRVPADLRLLRARSLRIEEAALTGESVPVEKGVEAAPASAALAERSSMAWSGTLVAAGSGAGVAVATGAATELGRISTMLGAVDQLQTPLLRQMARFARQVSGAVLAAAALLFGFATLLRGQPATEAFMAVVGMAVSAIPEGLPAIMTITLAIGVQRMAGRRAIIRQLPAVETLGAVGVICTDKTGTLTRNEMVATTLLLPGGALAVTGVGYEPGGDILRDGASLRHDSDPALRDLLRAALLCNDAELREVEGAWRVEGDPMEGALVVLARKAGLHAEAERSNSPRRDEIPFDSQHRYMATLHPDPDGGDLILLKGAPERILELCADAPDFDRAAWASQAEALAAEGQRVLGFAALAAPAGAVQLSAETLAGGPRLLGLIGFIDPPRPEAMAAVRDARAAGIRVVMITGDHAATAREIARQLGLDDAPEVLTGAEVEALDEAALRRAVGHVTVFARTTPEHKLRLVMALQAEGHTVAMTGDGVNDAPALKRADVGVAMGAKGTEAAKQAADMVLADDNFASIVHAVREGRTVYDNIRKVIGWTLPTNGGQALTIIAAILAGMVLPITPVQILWVNMVSSVALGTVLAFEPTEPGTMARPPRPRGEPLLTRVLVWQIILTSVLMACGAFGVFFWAESRDLPIETARTMVVNAIVVMGIAYLFSVRYVHGTSLTWRGVLGTPPVLMGLSTIVLAQLAFTYLPWLQNAFQSTALGVTESALVLGTGVVLLLVVEAEKRLRLRLTGG
ncbi:HAD-IC family P-type ATPase [Falsiroseomonas sp.]|uniref:HAD-IC family P-type ATPase n=1 Tax=Falsiroseomonas sp. TaxID=2870721 RepID=UPI002717F677|nr:HAD-IC family P-type ATPase [Falsiroseomonas sp.]MDO9500044.1 HAD-IC family P-type ATPase [Falsiroseomonas sp.]